jgi:putrescine aminotransferase
MDGFDLFARHVNPVMAQLEEMTGLNVRFIRAEECEIFDDRGQAYLDFNAGNGSFNLGHNHKEIVAFLHQTLDEQLLQVYSLGTSPYMGEAAAKLCALAGEPFDIAYFTNSGTEAVESALKLARAATGRSRVLYCSRAYHGTSLGSLSMMGQGPFRTPFEPLLPDFQEIPFQDMPSLDRELEKNPPAAFVLEPVQAENGVRVASEEYLKEALLLCRQHGTLVIFDEVQTGLGRSGSLFAYQYFGVRPDIVAIAKSLGGGILPMGAIIAPRAVHQKAYGTYTSCTSHHSTFGGNSLGCRVAIKALELLSAPALLEQTRETGRYLLDSLKKGLADRRRVRDIRGIGLLIGIEFEPDAHEWISWENMGLGEFAGLAPVPSLIMKYLLREKFVVNVASHDWNVLKIEPPLTISRRQIDRLVQALQAALDWIETIA